MASSFKPLRFIADAQLLDLSAEVLEKRISVDQHQLESLAQEKCLEKSLIDQEIKRLQARHAVVLARIDTEANTVKQRQQASHRALSHGRFMLSGLTKLPWEHLVGFLHPGILLHDLSVTNSFMRALIVNPIAGDPLCHPFSFRYDCARSMGSCIEAFKHNCIAKSSSTTLFDRQLGTAAYLVDTFGLSGGGKLEMARMSAEPPSCFNLHVENVKLQNVNEVEIQVACRHGKYERTQVVEPVIFRNLQQFMQNSQQSPRFGQPKAPFEDIFDRISPNHLKKYFTSVQEGFSAKVLRTYNASTRFQNELDTLSAKIRGPSGNNLNEAAFLEETYQRTNDYITRSVLKTQAAGTFPEKGVDYIDPRLLVAFSKRSPWCVGCNLTKYLLDRYPWARSVSADWRF